MNIIDAVQALKDGLCVGIKRLSWTGNGTRVLLSEDRLDEGLTFTESFLADDWQMVNPKPVMETVEVKRWATMDKRGLFVTTGYSEQDAKGHLAYHDGGSIVELTGHFQRPAPVKVKHRKEAGTFGAGYDADRRVTNAEIPNDAKLIFEWEE